MCHTVDKNYRPRGNIRYKVVVKKGCGYRNSFRNVRQRNYKFGVRHRAFDGECLEKGSYGFHVYTNKVPALQAILWRSTRYRKLVIVKCEMDEFIAGGVQTDIWAGNPTFIHETWKYMTILKEVS